MDFEEIEKIAIETYNNNIEYLKLNHAKLYEKIKLFETGLNGGLISPKYDLNYENGYFDALNLETNEYLYGEDTENYGNTSVKNQLDFSPKNCTFKAFYEIHFEDEVAKVAETATMYSDAVINNAPVVHYVNKNLPTNELMKTIPKLIIFGVGLGTHIPYLHLKAKAKVYFIIEPSLELFRLSLFTIKYSNLGKLARLTFSVAEDIESFGKSFDLFHGTGFIYNHYIKHFMFSNNCQIYVNAIQNKLVTQSHLTYDYARHMHSLQRTVDYIKDEYKIINITPKVLDNLSNRPVLFLAAGPSLQRNLEFVKKNKDKYIIVALYVLMPYLEKNGIKPDIITQYDQAGESVYKTIKDVKDLSFFNNSIFLFSTHVDRKVTDTFNQENMFLYQSMYDVKIGFSIQTAPSIGEITYALLLRLGVKELYLLGLDMAFDPETNKTHIDEHQFVSNDMKEEQNNKFTLTKDILQIKGNFRDEVSTRANFKMSVDTVNKLTTFLLKDDVNVYNLSDGAYFERIKPLRIKEININELKQIDKEEFYVNFSTDLNSISEKNFSSKDKELLLLRIESANVLKMKIEDFFAIKDGNLEVYENRLGSLINDICFGNYSCYELRNLLSNYIMNNAHYVYHLINMKSLQNPKKQLKAINKILQKQLIKIVDTYLNIYKDGLKED